MQILFKYPYAQIHFEISIKTHRNQGDRNEREKTNKLNKSIVFITFGLFKVIFN